MVLGVAVVVSHHLPKTRKSFNRNALLACCWEAQLPNPIAHSFHANNHSLYQQQPRTAHTEKMQQQLRGGQGALSRPVPSQQRVRSCFTVTFVELFKRSAVIEGCSCPAQVPSLQHHRRIVVTRAAAPQTVTAEEFIEVCLS